MKSRLVVSLSLFLALCMAGPLLANQQIFSSDNELVSIGDTASAISKAPLSMSRASMIDSFDTTPEYEWGLNADFAWANVFDTNDITAPMKLTEFQFHGMPTLGVTYEFYVTTDNGGMPDDSNITLLATRSDLNGGTAFDWVTIDISAADYEVQPGQTYWFIRTCPVGGWPGFTWSSATETSPPVNPPVMITQSFPTGGWGGWVTDWWMLFRLYGETGGPSLSVDQLVGGQPTTITVTDAGPFDTILVGYSTTGGGPTPTPYGMVLLSPPFLQIPAQTADASGTMVYTQTCPNVPGLHVWMQAYDVQAAALSNGFDGVIQ